jgi:tight adherence protein B
MSVWGYPALAFVGAALVVAAILYAFGAGSRRVGRRIDALGSDDAAAQGRQRGERSDRFPALTTWLERRGQLGALEGQLTRAGVNWLPSEFVAAWAAALVVAGIAGWLLFGALGAAAGVVLVLAGCILGLKALETKRLRQFDRQLPDALMLIASSLRSGYGILRALQAVRDEMGPPISIEFAKVLDETTLGVPTPEALTHLVQRVPLPDLDIAVTGVLIQLDVGGNLAELMEIVAAMVRERHRIRAEVDTLTAEGRLSGVVLFLLPLAMAAILTLLNRSYMSALFASTLGHIVIGSAIVLQILGGLVISRMLRVDF